MPYYLTLLYETQNIFDFLENSFKAWLLISEHYNLINKLKQPLTKYPGNNYNKHVQKNKSSEQLRVSATKIYYL